MPAKSEVIKIGNNLVPFSHPDKIFFPKKGITKEQILHYYLKISEILLPYLKDRPESLHRFPNGILGKSFYQKNITDELPKWAETRCIHTKSKATNYLICQNVGTLAYMVNLGCIETNVWNSRYCRPDNPDYAVIDMDPLDIDFESVLKTAMAFREIFKEAKIKAYCKTSGMTGIHIYIPTDAKLTHSETKQLAKIICSMVCKRLPGITSMERMPAKRIKKVYLDFLQNNLGSTMASAYSLRPNEDASVSTPLKWEELDKDIKPSDFTMENIFERIDKYGDLFKDALSGSLDVKNLIKFLEKTK